LLGSLIYSTPPLWCLKSLIPTIANSDKEALKFFHTGKYFCTLVFHTVAEEPFGRKEKRPWVVFFLLTTSVQNIIIAVNFSNLSCRNPPYQLCEKPVCKNIFQCEKISVLLCQSLQSSESAISNTKEEEYYISRIPAIRSWEKRHQQTVTPTCTSDNKKYKEPKSSPGLRRGLLPSDPEGSPALVFFIQAIKNITNRLGSYLPTYIMIAYSSVTCLLLLQIIGSYAGKSWRKAWRKPWYFPDISYKNLTKLARCSWKPHDPKLLGQDLENPKLL
jgi:hypothetical protein